MKFNFRKVASVIASVVMLGSTIGLAAAANYPAPFIAGGAADVGVVVGANAIGDLVAVTDMGISLQQELAKQTAVGGTSTSGSASGGDGISLATSSQKLYLVKNISSARTVLTASEMPNVLVDGKATDQSGTTYSYTQKITLGNRPISFTKSGESIDPIVVIDTSSSETTPIYNYSLTFTKALNTSDATNVQGYSKLKLLGQEYTIGANSDYDTLYLYGSGTPLTVAGGETGKFTVNGKEHTVTLVTTSSATQAKITIDGETSTRSVNKGSSYKVGDFEIYIQDVIHPTVQGDPRQASFLVGANTIHLENGQNVRTGSDDTTVLATVANIVGSAASGGITSISIAQAAKDSIGDYVSQNATYEDRVFGGLKLQFASLVPSLSSTTRDSVVIDTDNAVAARVKFTSAQSGAGETTFTYAKDGDLQADSSLSAVNLVNANNYTIHVLEAESIARNDIVIIHNSAKDEGRILQLTQIGSGTSTNDKTTFQDVLNPSQAAFDFSTGATNQSTLTIDGDVYYVNVTTAGNSGAVKLTWGAGAGYSAAGTQTTLFPRIKLKNGEWMTFLSATTISNATTYQLPGNYLLSDYIAGAAMGATGFLNTNTGVGHQDNVDFSKKMGNINYSIDVAAGNVTGILWAIDTANDGTPDCVFNSTYGPAVLIEEEKTLDDSNGHAICIPLTTEGTTTVMPAISSPVFTDKTGSLISLTSDTNKNQQVDIFGTLVERDSSNNNKVTVSYPDDQMYADIWFTATATTVAGGTVSGGTVTGLGTVTVKDTEYAQVKTKNVVVIGGSCINTVAATLLGSTTPMCGAAFTTATGTNGTGIGADQYLIQSFANADASGKVALLVAGYEAADTANAVKYLTTVKPDVAVGKKYKGTTATQATSI